MGDTLEKCPFCGAKESHLEVRFFLKFTHGYSGVSVVCKKCDVVGPLRPTQGEAQDSWNRRTVNEVDQ